MRICICARMQPLIDAFGCNDHTDYLEPRAHPASMARTAFKGKWGIGEGGSMDCGGGSHSIPPIQAGGATWPPRREWHRWRAGVCERFEGVG